jgi:hypothetical protein
MQEHSDSIKRQNMCVMGLKEGEKVQAKENVIYSIK